MAKKSKKGRKEIKPRVKKAVSSKKTGLKKSPVKKKDIKSAFKSRALPTAQPANENISASEPGVRDTRPAEQPIKVVDKLPEGDMKKGSAKAEVNLFDK